MFVKAISRVIYVACVRPVFIVSDRKLKFVNKVAVHFCHIHTFAHSLKIVIQA